MQCEEDWLVMHVLFAQHWWSISKIAQGFGSTGGRPAGTPRQRPSPGTGREGARPSSARRSSPTCSVALTGATTFWPRRSTES
jgi:hypothetical protein